MMRRVGMLWRAVAVTAVLATAAACGSAGSADTSSSSTQPPQEFEKVVLGTVSNLLHTPAYVAVQKGFFAENGLNVELKLFGSGSDASKALQAGTVQFNTISTTSIASARNAGLNVKLIVSEMNDATTANYTGPLGIVARADSGIKAGDAASLKGKKVAVLTGSTTQQYFDLYLEANGMTEKDVKLVNLPVGDHPVSLKQGDVDAAVSWEPYVAQAIRELGSEAVVVSRGEPLMGYILGVAATDEYIGADKGVLEKFAAAIAQADWFARNNPEEATDAAANYLPGVDRADILDAITNHLKFDPRLSPCVTTAFEETSASMFKSGKIDADIPAADMIAPKYMEAVEKAHPDWFADLPPLDATCTK